MRHPRLKGKRYIGLVRCSSKGQADTSIDDQLVVLEAFAREHEMVHIDDVQLEGVSGSVPGNRSDIDHLVERKHSRDDFDVLLVHDTTRFTRSGPKHGAKLEYDLESVGIEVIFVTDNLPEGDFADVYKSVLYFSGKQHAKSISLASARGSMSSLQQGRSAYCRRPPYGIDKLYISANGTPIHIIRNQPDGTQLKLNPETNEIIGRFGRNEGRGIPRHYIKQKDERIELIPGDEQQVAVVRQIFARRHLDQRGYYRIARELNDKGVPSPSGRSWSVGVIRRVLLNPIYIGIGIANRYSSAIYNMRAPETPVQVESDAKSLAGSRRPPTHIRPREDWQEREEKALSEYLDGPVRELATVKLHDHLDQQATGHTPKSNKDRHSDSSFFLKGVLISKQGGFPLTGRHTGRTTSKKRYYAVSKAFSTPRSKSVLSKMVPADPIERAVLGVLQFVMVRAPDRRELIGSAIERQQRTAAADHAELKELNTQRQTLKRKLEFIIDQLDDIGRDAAKGKAGQIQSQLRALEKRIVNAGSPRASKDGDFKIAVDRVARRFEHLADGIDELPKTALKRLVHAFVSRAVVDLETKDVEIELRLPSWALSDAESMCLDSTFPCKWGNEAHPDSAYPLVKMRLMWWNRTREYFGYDFGEAA